MEKSQWQFVSNQRKHTQDGPNLVSLMKNIGKGLRKIKAVDIGCGDGIIAIEMLSRKRVSHVMCIDIAVEASEAARHNLSQFAEAGTWDVRLVSARGFFRQRKNWELYDLMAINPPFYSKGSGVKTKNEADWLARHDSRLDIRQWAKGAARILKTGGELYCIFPTERLAEALRYLSEAGVEPKEIWWFKNDLRKRRFFLKALRGGKPGLISHFNYE